MLLVIVTNTVPLHCCKSMITATGNNWKGKIEPKPINLRLLNGSKSSPPGPSPEPPVAILLFVFGCTLFAVFLILKSRDFTRSSSWWLVRARARCSWSQVSAFQHYHNITLASSLSQSLYSPPPPPPPRSYPPFGSNPSSLRPTTLCPDSRLPPPPLHPGPGLLDLPVTLPVNHAFHFSSPSTAYTGPVIHCLSPCPYRPPSVLQTSVGPGLLIPSAFYTPPALN